MYFHVHSLNLVRKHVLFTHVSCPLVELVYLSQLNSFWEEMTSETEKKDQI